MRKRFPKVPVGKNSFCYSGPNCRQHGTEQFVHAVAQKLDSEKFKNYLSDDAAKSYAQLPTVLADQICENSIDLNDLHELDDDSMLPGQATRWCNDHDAYHVFETGTFVNTTLIKSRQEANLKIKAAFQTGDITGPELQSLLQEAKENQKKFTILLDEAKATLAAYQHSIVGTQLRERADAKRELYRAEHRAMSTITPKVYVPEGPPKLDESKVPDAVMLEYWQCGRKRTHESMDAANTWLADKASHDTMDGYACRHCGSFHVGHGGGLDSVESQLERARVHWTKNSSKSDVFAFKKSLI